MYLHQMALFVQARNLQFGMLSSDEFLLRKWFSQTLSLEVHYDLAKPEVMGSPPKCHKICFEIFNHKANSAIQRVLKGLYKIKCLSQTWFKKKNVEKISVFNKLKSALSSYRRVLSNSQHQKLFSNRCYTTQPNQILI